MKEVEVMTVDGQDYIILKEVFHNQISYVFLSNIQNPDDVMIRKNTLENPNQYIPLESEDEYRLVTSLLMNE